MSFSPIREMLTRLTAWQVAVLGIVLCFGVGCSTHSTTQEASSTAASVTPDLMKQTLEEAASKSTGCVSCHTQVDAPTMHLSPAVHLGCTDCHGGNAAVQVATSAAPHTPPYNAAKQHAHVQPRFPEAWPTSANPERSYTLLNHETPEFIRFINPGDLRVAQETCGSCHPNEVRQVSTSLMTTTGVFWTAAAYNNGIVPFKPARFGESYSRNGVAQKIEMVPPPTPEEVAKGALPFLLPLPRWEILPPGDIFRVFEDGGVFIPSLFPDIGNPNPLEEGGKPDIRQSNRGLGTGLRISVPVLNIHKTRLNDPHLSFLGTNVRRDATAVSAG